MGLDIAAYIFSFLIAAATAALTLAAVVSLSGTGAFANVVIVGATTLVVTYLATAAMTRSRRAATIASVSFTVIVVVLGFVLVYAIYDSLCGSNSSAC